MKVYICNLGDRVKDHLLDADFFDAPYVEIQTAKELYDLLREVNSFGWINGDGEVLLSTTDAGYDQQGNLIPAFMISAP